MSVLFQCVRLCARHLSVLCLAVPFSPSASALNLAEAERLALNGQPQLQGLAARRQAAAARAVSAAQLPDPQMTAGISNLPVTGESRFDIGDDFMTMTSVGLMQAFPRAEKRRLRGRAAELEAEQIAARGAVAEAAIRRDVGLAYVDAWAAQQALALVRELIAEARREHGAQEIALRTDRADPVQYLDAQVAVELLEDRRLSLIQAREQAQAALVRWTGPLPGDTPTFAAPPAPDVPFESVELLSSLEAHPELRAAHADIAGRENEVALARADYRPDWWVEVGYSWRPEYSDMAMVQFGWDLPLFTARRQDPALAASAAEAEAVHAMHRDHARDLGQQVRDATARSRHLQRRIARFDAALLPAARARRDAALAAYRAGKSALSEVLRARREVLDVELMRLELLADQLRSRLQLRYLATRGD